MKCYVVHTNLGTIEYSIKGQGKPVIFFHGGLSNCRDTLWHQNWDLTSYQLITPSRPGYGKTPLAQNGSPKKVARLVHQLLVELDISSPIIVGISAGAPAAIAYAALYPQDTHSLILMSAVTKRWITKGDPMYSRIIRLFGSRYYKNKWKIYRAYFGLMPKLAANNLLREMSSKPQARTTAPETAQVKEMVFNSATGEGLYTDLKLNTSKRLLQNVQCPTLILHSEYDKLVPLDMAFYAEQTIPNTKVKTYPNKWGHLLWVGADSRPPLTDIQKFLALQS